MVEISPTHESKRCLLMKDVGPMDGPYVLFWTADGTFPRVKYSNHFAWCEMFEIISVEGSNFRFKKPPTILNLLTVHVFCCLKPKRGKPQHRIESAKENLATNRCKQKTLEPRVELHCFPYCWWKKSCTSWSVGYPHYLQLFYIPGGAGFRPSTVFVRMVSQRWCSTTVPSATWTCSVNCTARTLCGWFKWLRCLFLLLIYYCWGESQNLIADVLEFLSGFDRVIWNKHAFGRKTRVKKVSIL